MVREAVERRRREGEVGITRRAFAAGIAAALAACRRSKSDGGPGPTPGPSPVPADAAARGARWLASRQSADGSWVSDVYGAFKEGFSLTPFASLALLEAGHERDAARKGVAWLTAKTKDGRVEPGRITPSYPAYTAALAVRALSHPSSAAPRAARDAWLSELRGRQLTEALGWSKEDVHYGGWGYATVIPRKPPAGTAVQDAFLESNLSSTAFALDALAAAGVPADDPAYAAARVFVERQQNYAAPASAVDDGGFFFVPHDEVRNKAGRAETAASLVRFHSYGTMTADGLRSLLRCGARLDEPRAAAALRWLRDRFDATHHPGTYRPEREEVRDSAWFYWAASASATLRMAAGGESAWWSVPFRAELVRRQRADGSWSNDLIAVREDDPVVATSFALIALASSSAG